jgi:hypothetical protein
MNTNDENNPRLKWQEIQPPGYAREARCAKAGAVPIQIELLADDMPGVWSWHLTMVGHTLCRPYPLREHDPLYAMIVAENLAEDVFVAALSALGRTPSLEQKALARIAAAHAASSDSQSKFPWKGSVNYIEALVKAIEADVFTNEDRAKAREFYRKQINARAPLTTEIREISLSLTQLGAHDKAERLLIIANRLEGKNS